MKLRSVNNIAIIMIVFLLSLVMLLYIFEFGIVHAQISDQNNNNKEIDNNFDYIFDPGNYIEFEKEEIEKNENIIVRNDESDNKNDSVQSSSSTTTDLEGEKEVESSSNINTVNKKNSESKLRIIDGN
ncbi:MAG: hypothetical protein AB7F53_09245, partial [Nitrososphaeraceae archaeon]